MKEFSIPEAGASIRYQDLAGNALSKCAPIVFIHGLGCASSFDYPQVASMTGLRQHRAILIDLLGSGYSDKPKDFEYSIASHACYLNKLINHLGLNNFYLFGHSMGGSIAIALAEKCQSKLQGLILAESNLDSGGGEFSTRIAALSEEEFLNKGYIQTCRSAKQGGNGNWAAGLEASSPLAVHRESVSLVKGQSPSWRETLYELNLAKTFIFGEHSLPDADRAALADQGIHIEIVPNAGHSMAWDNPEGLAIAIQNGIRITT
ncbi:MAG: alpha/beta fold hydrolase [Desulfovibrio sp.]